MMRRLVRRALAGIRALLQRDRIEQDLGEELAAYLETAVDRHMSAGLSREAATRAARLELGSTTAVKQHVREATWESSLESIWQDLRYAVRGLLRSRGFAAVSILTLALGIGASTAIFTLLNAILLRPLPVDRPEELVELRGVGNLISYPMYRDLREHQQVLTDIAVTASETPMRMTIPRPTQPLRLDNVRVSRATGTFFALLGIRPAAGRFFTSGDDHGPGNSETSGSVVVLSYEFWQRQLSADSNILGQTVYLDRSPARVIGVAPREFTGERAGSSPDAWVPTTPFTPENQLETRLGTFGSRIARLKPGVTRQQAEASLTALFQRLLTDEGIVTDNISRYGIRLISARSGVVSFVGVTYLAPLAIVMAIASLMLLIACANIANLLIARGVARRSELRVRLSIGCGRGRLIRQLLTESLLLSSVGAAAGIGVALWGTAFLTGMVSGGETPISIDVSPDVRVVLFLVGLCVVTGVGFGIAPALRASRLDPAAPGAMSGSRGVAGRACRPNHALVTMQLALSLLLLVGAGLLFSSLQNLRATDAGFVADNVFIFELHHNPRASDDASLVRVADDIQRHVAAIPGVESASVSWVVLFGGAEQRQRVAVPGFTPAGDVPGGFVDGNGIVRARFNPVSPGYLETVGMTLLEGRTLEDRDRAPAPRVAVINESMARAYFGGRALGRTFLVPSSPAPATSSWTPIEVVGIVRDAKFNDIREETRAMFYVPLAQHPRPVRSIEVRTRAAAGPVILAARQALEDAAPDVMVSRVVSLSDQVDQTLSAERLMMTLSSFFGVVALLLACIGLHGVLTYAVAQRTREIGVRVALGATRNGIVGLVLGQVVPFVFVGLGLGVLLSLAATRLLSRFLYGVTATDAPTFAIATALLLSAATISAWWPSWRAAHIDPATSLREA